MEVVSVKLSELISNREYWHGFDFRVTLSDNNGEAYALITAIRHKKRWALGKPEAQEVLFRSRDLKTMFFELRDKHGAVYLKTIQEWETPYSIENIESW